MPSILGANTLSSGFDVSNSVRFDAGSGPYLSRATSGDGNQRKFTFSVWLKMDIHASGATHKIFDHGDATNYFTIYYTAEPYLVVKGRNANSNVLELIPSASFRDPAAWKHLYVAVDTTQSTASNRAKIYINGNRVTALATATYPDQNTDFEIQDSGEPFEIGTKFGQASGEYYDGYMAEFVFVDGAVQDIADFGEADEDSGIWKPKNVSGIAVNPDGANGFYLDFKDSSNLGNDASGGTDFGENNIAATDQSTDVPTNNFATMNPLDNFYAAHPLAEGNTKVSTSTSTTSFSTATIGLSTGKWYFEGTVRAVMGEEGIGVSPLVSTASDDYPGKATDSVSYKGNNGNVRKSNSNASYGDAYANNDVIGVMLNLDDNEIKFSKNGTIQNSSTAVALTAAASTPNGVYFPMVGDGSTDSVGVWEVNFGAGSFTALSSAQTDSNGIGAFEYEPPSGFLAICTKNLAESG